MKTITACTIGHKYPIMVGASMGQALARKLQMAVGQARLFVFIDANVFALHGKSVRRSLGIPARQRRELVVPSGEKAKSFSQLAGLYDFLLGEKISRDDFVLAVGGGVTSDLVGYAAATVLRGVRWGVLTTTLLGMVDASIGGKTGVNHGRGKNLVGAFHQPDLVVADLAYLITLPERQMIAGLGEVLKTAGLSGHQAVAALESYLDRGDLYNMKALTHLVYDCATLKAGVVERDERESGARMVLNFGHTFAHGIERTLGYGRLLHGEAVILGILAALELGRLLDLRSTGLDHYRELVERLAACVPPRRMEARQILSAMALDKKRSATDQRYVMLKQLGKPVIKEKVERRTVEAAAAAMLRTYRQVR